MKNLLSIALLLLTVNLLSAQEKKLNRGDQNLKELCSFLETFTADAKNDFTNLKASAKNEHTYQSKKSFPAAFESVIVKDKERHIFSAKLTESSDRNLLIDDYGFFYDQLVSCLGNEYQVNERLRESELGQVMSAWRKDSNGGKVQLYLEFSKSDLSNAAYCLNLTIYHEE
jgi:hypothetical protein